MKRYVFFAGVLFLYAPWSLAGQGNSLVLGDFSGQPDATIPADWQPMTFPSVENHTRYQLVDLPGGKVIRAESRAAASGLTTNVRFDPRKYPYISWRWKVEQALKSTDVNTKSGDDYAARVYVSFDYDINKLPAGEKTRVKLFYLIKGFYPPLATLNYIWAGATPNGKIVPSPYTNRVKMIVVKNHSSQLQHWYVEERNILEDYRAAFGEEPGDVISVSLMTDTDNAGEETVSYYGNIQVSDKPMLSGPRVSQVNEASYQATSLRK